MTTVCGVHPIIRFYGWRTDVRDGSGVTDVEGGCGHGRCDLREKVEPVVIDIVAVVAVGGGVARVDAGMGALVVQPLAEAPAATAGVSKAERWRSVNQKRSRKSVKL